MRIGRDIVDTVLIDDDPCIERIRCSFRHRDRIYIDFCYLRKIYDKVGEAHDYLLKLLQVSGLLAPISLEQAVSFCFLHEPAGQGLIERWQGHSEVLEDLNTGAAHTKQDNRPEILVFLRPEDDFVVYSLNHLLDSDADYFCFRATLRNPFQHPFIFSSKLFFRGYSRYHPSHVALVRDVW